MGKNIILLRMIRGSEMTDGTIWKYWVVKFGDGSIGAMWINSQEAPITT